MDDILLASPSAEELQCIFLNTEIKLRVYELHIAVINYKSRNHIPI